MQKPNFSWKHRLLTPLVLTLFLMGCATSSETVRTEYVPLDSPRVVCGGAKIEDSFKEAPPLDSAELDPVETDDDVEVLAKTALDDLVNYVIAFATLRDETEKLEDRCAREEQDALADRQTTLEQIDELNKP